MHGRLLKVYGESRSNVGNVNNVASDETNSQLEIIIREGRRLTVLDIVNALERGVFNIETIVFIIIFGQLTTEIMKFPKQNPQKLDNHYFSRNGGLRVRKSDIYASV